ncbi:hypothetical protein NDU88_007810 [Pleurodeles waltl]|uniref:Reverse transcriptase zinc-binding domain-containing protein n=1 Tax=Pleurodeles waltl TaxID=8319 RepID=A0AAV7N4R0_PLEWA|nr:hypothetical protein NDU88_007810 [Pleurodeles waltl]
MIFPATLKVIHDNCSHFSDSPTVAREWLDQNFQGLRSGRQQEPVSQNSDRRSQCTCCGRDMVLDGGGGPSRDRDLRQGTEKAIQIFARFALLSGLRINPDKSYAYSFQGSWLDPMIPFEPLTIVTAPISFRYLGILAYLTPNRLNRIYYTTKAHCPRCHTANPDLLHMFWSCPSLTQYWNAIGATVVEVMDESVELSPAYFLLGLYPLNRIAKVRMRFMDLVLLLAKHQLTRRWKSPHAPSLLSWKDEVLHWSQAESATLRREEYRGLRRKPTSLEWDSLVEVLRAQLETWGEMCWVNQSALWGAGVRLYYIPVASTYFILKGPCKLLPY